MPPSITVYVGLQQKADTAIHASAAYCALLSLVKFQHVAAQQPTYDPHMTVSKLNSINFCFAGAMAMSVHVRTAGMLQAQGMIAYCPKGQWSCSVPLQLLVAFHAYTHNTLLCYATHFTQRTLIAFLAGLPSRVALGLSEPAPTFVVAAVPCCVSCDCSKILLAYACERGRSLV